jgi:hypothetical protein
LKLLIYNKFYTLKKRHKIPKYIKPLKFGVEDLHWQCKEMQMVHKTMNENNIFLPGILSTDTWFYLIRKWGIKPPDLTAILWILIANVSYLFMWFREK